MQLYDYIRFKRNFDVNDKPHFQPLVSSCSTVSLLQWQVENFNIGLLQNIGYFFILFVSRYKDTCVLRVFGNACRDLREWGQV